MINTSIVVVYGWQYRKTQLLNRAALFYDEKPPSVIPSPMREVGKWYWQRMHDNWGHTIGWIKRAVTYKDKPSRKRPFAEPFTPSAEVVTLAMEKSLHEHLAQGWTTDDKGRWIPPAGWIEEMRQALR